MKTYKKHKFISMEKLAKDIGHEGKQINIFIHPTKEESVRDSNADIRIEQFQRTGFGQYALEEVENWYFEIKYLNPDYDPNLEYDEENTDSHEGFKLRIHRPLMELTDYIGECVGFPMTKAKSIKPIYKLKEKRSGDVINSDVFPSGNFIADMIGILVKY